MKDGSYYQGSFRNDEIEGKGFRTYAFSGDNYEGNFLKGEPCGEGVMTYSNGSRYEGSWKSGKYEGIHVQHWSFRVSCSVCVRFSHLAFLYIDISTF